MKTEAVYSSKGPIRAVLAESIAHGRFKFILFDKSGNIKIFMDDENEASARLAVAAFNCDLAELRRLLDAADVAAKPGQKEGAA